MANTIITQDSTEIEANKANTLNRPVTNTSENNIKDNVKQQNINFLKLGSVNVITDYKWTVKDDNSHYYNRVPKIMLYEFQPTGNQFAHSYVGGIKNAASSITQKLSDLFKVDSNTKDKFNEFIENITNGEVSINEDYQRLYKGIPTENIYTFPFISTYVSDINNNWNGQISDVDESFNKLTASLGSIFGNTSSPLFGSGVGAVDTMKVWAPGSPASYTFSFELHNTMVTHPVEKVSNFIKNYNLIRTLKFNNLPERLSSNVLLQPVIYRVDIPGIHYSPASTISNLKIESLGQKDMIFLPVNLQRDKNTGLLYQDTSNSIDNYTSIEIPDAYKITITITDLYVETKELFFSSFTKDVNKVTVTYDDPTSTGGTEIQGL